MTCMRSKSYVVCECVFVCLSVRLSVTTFSETTPNVTG